jgi:hypothetical protein
MIVRQFRFLNFFFCAFDSFFFTYKKNKLNASSISFYNWAPNYFCVCVGNRQNRNSSVFVPVYIAPDTEFKRSNENLKNKKVAYTREALSCAAWRSLYIWTFDFDISKVEQTWWTISNPKSNTFKNTKVHRGLKFENFFFQLWIIKLLFSLTRVQIIHKIGSNIRKTNNLTFNNVMV